MVVTGLGVGLFYSSITTAAVTALDPSRSSLAGGIVYMFQVAGGSVGLGLTTTVFTTASEDKLQSAATGLSEGEIEDVQGVLAGTESGRVHQRERAAESSSSCARRSPPGLPGRSGWWRCWRWRGWWCRCCSWAAHGGSLAWAFGPD